MIERRQIVSRARLLAACDLLIFAREHVHYMPACWPHVRRGEQLLHNRAIQRAACCSNYFPNPEVRHPPNQHRLSRWSPQQWSLVVRLLWNHLLLPLQVVLSYARAVTRGADTS